MTPSASATPRPSRPGPFLPIWESSRNPIPSFSTVRAGAGRRLNASPATRPGDEAARDGELGVQGADVVDRRLDVRRRPALAGHVNPPIVDGVPRGGAPESLPTMAAARTASAYHPARRR